MGGQLAGRWIPPMVLAMLVGALAGLVSLAPAFSDAPQLQLEIEFSPSVSGVLQVFYDRGMGIREADSISMPFMAADTPRLLHLPVPYGIYGRLRIDPNTRDGRYEFHRLRVVDVSGREVASLPVANLRPAYQVAREPSPGQTAVFVTAPGANDPQIVYEPGAPIVLAPPVRNLIGGLGWFAGVFAAVAIALLLLNRAPALGAAVGRGRGWADARPMAAAVLAGVVGTAAAMYPLFLGRSLVSPANGPAAMLYDQAPFSYGYDAPPPEDARGSDIGATMWALLPYTVVQREALAAGEAPLWNRYNTIGEPLWGQGQTFIMDPFHLASLLVPDLGLALDLRFAAARAVFAIGTGVAVVAVTGSWPAGAMLALVAPFVGHFTMRFNHPAYFSIVYAPWILWAYLRLGQSVGRGRWRGAAWLAAATYLQMVGSTPKEGLIALLTAHLAGMAGLLLARGRWADKLGRVDAALLGGIAAMLLTAPHWLIFLDTLRRSWTLYDQPSIQIASAPHLIAYLLGGIAPGAVLTGAHPLAILAAAGALAFPRRLRESGGALGALIAIAIVGGVAFGAVPTDILLRMPLLPSIHHVANTFLAATIAPLLLLGGCGVAWLVDLAEGEYLAAVLALGAGTVALSHIIPGGSAEFGTVLVLITVVAAAAVLLAVTTMPVRAPGAVIALGGVLYLSVAGGGLHLETGVAAADQRLIQPRSRADLDERSPALDAVRLDAGRTPYRVAPIESVLFAGTQALWGLESIGGPDALRLPAIEEVSDLTLVERTPWVWRTLLHPDTIDSVRGFLDMVNVRYLVARRDQVPGGLRVLPQEGADQLRAAERPTAWPRAFFVDGVEQHESVPALAERIRHARGPFASVAAVDHEAVAALPAQATTVRPARDYALTPNTTTFTVESDGPGLAVLSEAFVERDFQASLNGQSVAYVRVNHALKGVVIPGAGTWTVRFAYRPALWAWSWTLAVLGLCLTATLTLAKPLLTTR